MSFIQNMKKAATMVALFSAGSFESGYGGGVVVHGLILQGKGDESYAPRRAYKAPAPRQSKNTGAQKESTATDSDSAPKKAFKKPRRARYMDIQNDRTSAPDTKAGGAFRSKYNQSPTTTQGILQDQEHVDNNMVGASHAESGTNVESDDKENTKQTAEENTTLNLNDLTEFPDFVLKKSEGSYDLTGLYPRSLGRRGKKSDDEHKSDDEEE